MDIKISQDLAGILLRKALVWRSSGIANELTLHSAKALHAMPHAFYHGPTLLCTCLNVQLRRMRLDASVKHKVVSAPFARPLLDAEHNPSDPKARVDIGQAS